jgi:hypothetical protein
MLKLKKSKGFKMKSPIKQMGHMGAIMGTGSNTTNAMGSMPMPSFSRPYNSSKSNSLQGAYTRNKQSSMKINGI